jgi:signal peptidase I
MPDAAADAGPSLIREVLRRYGFARVRAYGGSMTPAIHPGDVLNVRAASASELVVGDVVLFEREGRLFAHRVVRQTAAGVVETRGDAHSHLDPDVEPSQILGIVETVVPGGSRFWFMVQRAAFGLLNSCFRLRTLNVEP